MFYLVGSRFYGTHARDSDYDFLAEDTSETREFLEAHRFVRLESRHVRYHKHNIDICLVNNLAARIYARDNSLQYSHLPKMERHAKVQELIDAYELGRLAELE